MDWLKKLLSVTRRTCFHETYVHGSYLTVAAQKKGTEQFHLNPTLLPQSLPLKLLVSHTQRKRSVVLSFPTPLCHVRAVQTAVCFQPPKRFSFPFHDPFKNLMLLPLSICCRNSCAVTRSWGCRTGLYSCLVFEPFCFKQEHSLIRAKHSFMLCTSSEDIFWTKATKSRSSCMHRPHSWPILAPTAAKKTNTRGNGKRWKKEKFLPSLSTFCTYLPPWCLPGVTDVSMTLCAAAVKETSFCTEKATLRNKTDLCGSPSLWNITEKAEPEPRSDTLPLLEEK